MPPKHKKEHIPAYEGQEVIPPSLREALDKLGPNATHDQVQAAARKVSDEIDNRFGQVNYDNWFMDRKAKDLMMLLERAPGWNMGTWKLLAGGIKNIPKNAVSIAKGDPLLEAQAGRASEPQSKKFSLTKLKPDILIGFVEEGGDPASMAKRFGQIVDGAKAGNSHCLTAILRIASVFKDKGIQADAGDILLERFGDKDGVLLYLAIRCPSGAIRTKSVRRMAENNKEYLLELASKESGYPDTRMEAKKLLDGGV